MHISFVRSITMDAFKGNEILRMEKGGNEPWRRFWTERTGRVWGKLDPEMGVGGWEERYGGEVGEEWKERLGCVVEGREFRGWPEKKKKKREEVAMGRGEGLGEGDGGVGMGMGAGGRNRKEMNEDFFARKGGENEMRRADLPPSQGGKYAGFGSAPADAGGSGRGAGKEGMPGVDEFQKDPVAALTKGFGWFTTTVGKGVKEVNDGWIQPNVQKVGGPFSLSKLLSFSPPVSPLSLMKLGV